MRGSLRWGLAMLHPKPSEAIMTKDIYQTITDRIIEELEKGAPPWRRPWDAGSGAGGLPLRANGVPYRGINVVMLWGQAAARGFASPYWMSFRQAIELGGHVRKGEKGSPVVFASSLQRTETDESGAEVERDIPFMKGYTVFNTDQIEGLPERYRQHPVAKLEPAQRIAHAEAFFQATGAVIRYGGAVPYYLEGEDRIQMPPFEAFKDPESFYATLAHEAVHWAKHPARLDRDFGGKRHGDEGYAKEELVAELGAAFVCARLELPLHIREDHAPYIDYWLKLLQADKRAIFTAAAHAQRAADFLQAFSREVSAQVA